MILVLMITAVAIVVMVGIIKGIFPLSAKNVPKRMSGRTYTFVGSVYAFSAIAILSVMMVINPSDAYNSSLYGIGLGLVTIISSVLLRLYRSYSYGE